MSEPEPYAYDVVAYDGNPFGHTHPARLATIAHIHGMTPVPSAAMRVLELGCGNGGNLIPMALQYPGAHFVGIDLSARAIDEARQIAGELDLANIVFEHRDIMAVSPTLGQFDYIIAHGVYSWVPEAVRDKMLAIFGGMLTAHGVAYVSYNALPGCRLRDIARDVMLYAVRDIVDPMTRARDARLALKAFAEASNPDTFHGAGLRARLAEVDGIPDRVLVHDDLNPSARAFAFHEVIAAAQRHNLQFLSEASFPMQFGTAKPTARQMLASLSADDRLVQEQSYDLLVGRFFRETLLCRSDVVLPQGPAPIVLAGYHLSAEVQPARDQEEEENRPGVERFAFAAGVKLSVDLHVAKAALRILGALWPGSITYQALVDLALQDAAAEIGSDVVREVTRLDEALTAMVSTRLVECHREPLTLTAVISERPVASPLARMQARRGAMVTDLRHRSIMLNGVLMRHFLCLLDGSRDADALLAGMNAFIADAHASGEAADLPAAATADEVATHLRAMSRLALLCG